jgi:hypothetical protein
MPGMDRLSGKIQVFEDDFERRLKKFSKMYSKTIGGSREVVGVGGLDMREGAMEFSTGKIFASETPPRRAPRTEPEMRDRVTIIKR